MVTQVEAGYIIITSPNETFITVPKTWIGKIVASCFSVFAISFFALPAVRRKFLTTYRGNNLPGDFGLGLRSQGAAKAETEALQQVGVKKCFFWYIFF